MRILLNGASFEVPGPLLLSELLEQLELSGKRLAVEVNLEIVPRSEHAQLRLGEGDRVEIVHAIGGG